MDRRDPAREARDGTPDRPGKPSTGRHPCAPSLRARLLLLVLLAVLPAFVLLGYQDFMNQERVFAKERADAIHMVQTATAAQRRLIIAARELLFATSQTPELIRARKPSCDAYLARLLDRDSRLANIGLIARNGSVLCSARPVPRSVNLADRAYFRRAIQTGTFSIGDYEIGRITHLPSVNVGYPILDSHHDVREVLFAALRLSWIHRLAARSMLPPGSALAMLDSRYHVLVRYPNGKRWAGKTIPPGTLFDAIRHCTGLCTANAKGLQGTQRLFAFSDVSAAPTWERLHVLVAIPYRIARIAAHRTAEGDLALVGLITALMLLLAWAGADVFVLRNVRSLLAATRRLAGGDLTARTNIRAGANELTQLASAFDSMAEGLEQRTLEAEEQSARVRRLNRIHAVLSGINGAILRTRERQPLLDAACRIAVDHGGFQLAFVGLRDPASNLVRPVACAGPAAAYIDDLKISSDEQTAEGRGPIGQALRECHHMVCNDIATDPRMIPWRARAQALHLHSVACFPLLEQQDVVGTIAFYSEEKNFFDTEEIRLLQEVSSDTSLALEYIEKDKRLDYLAYHDTLTGLPNRTLFRDRIEQALAQARRGKKVLGILTINILNFRAVTDTLGRGVGDAVLQQISSRLTAIVRESDSIAYLGADSVARLGGNEFALLLVGTQRPEHVNSVANRIQQALAEPFQAGGESLPLHSRAAIAMFPQDGDDPDTLLNHAELALHTQAPPVSDSVVFYSAEMNARATERRRLEQELNQACERGEFVLHYQPQVDLDTGEIRGAEALLRWQHPKRGLIPPAEFVPLLEDSGLIIPVGEWVVRETCRQQARWTDRFERPLRLSLNASARQFQDLHFAERILALTKETCVDPTTLELEITESVLMEDARRTVEILHSIKEIGLRISIDDFGTGYSSLSYLRQFPVDVLKIDRSFVRDIVEDTDCLAIARSIIALAHTLDIRVIAEGVETEAQLRLMIEHGCDEVQGYYFSRPIPHEAFFDLAQSQGRFDLPLRRR